MNSLERRSIRRILGRVSYSCFFPSRLVANTGILLGCFAAASAISAASVPRLTWKDNSDNESGFSIERSADGKDWEVIGVVDANVNVFEDPSPIAIKRAYYYRVRAFNDYGFSPYTNAVDFSFDPGKQWYEGEWDGGLAGRLHLRLNVDGTGWLLGEGSSGSSGAFSKRIELSRDASFAVLVEDLGMLVGFVGSRGVELEILGGDGERSEGTLAWALLEANAADGDNPNSSAQRYEFEVPSADNGRIELEVDANRRGLAFVELGEHRWIERISLTSGAAEIWLDSSKRLSLSLIDGQVSGEIHNGDDLIAIEPEPLPSLPESYLSNVSIRTWIEGGSKAIAGFVVSGDGRKRLLVRAIGPELRDMGLKNVVDDPRLSLRAPGSSAAIAENRHWQESNDSGGALADAAELAGAFPLNPGSNDAGLLVELEPGLYWVFIENAGASGGTALVEVYDLDGVLQNDSSSWLANVSMRNWTGPERGPIIAGFVVSGEGSQGLLIRGMGNELSDFNVPRPLRDPLLKLFRQGNPNPVATNDDWDTWSESLNPYAEEVGAFGFQQGSNSAAMVQWLEPGLYTSVVRSVDSHSGEVLVEVYALP